MYADDTLPDGAVPHLLSASSSHQSTLRSLLQEYKDVFPSTLPRDVPPNRDLGDEHRIPLVPDAKPVHKSMYRHSP